MAPQAKVLMIRMIIFHLIRKKGKMILRSPYKWDR